MNVWVVVEWIEARPTTCLFMTSLVSSASSGWREPDDRMAGRDVQQGVADGQGVVWCMKANPKENGMVCDRELGSSGVATVGVDSDSAEQRLLSFCTFSPAHLNAADDSNCAAMLALATTPALHSEPSTSWHHAPSRRPAVRSHSHTTQPLFHHHDQPPHQSQRLARAVTSALHGTPSASSSAAATQPVRPAEEQPQPPMVSAIIEQPAQEQAASTQSTAPVDLHSIPQKDLIKHLANLLAQIAAANDALPQPEIPNRSAPVDDLERPPIWNSLTTAARGAFGNPTSALAFHARNIPTFPLEAYLLRILKYCPIPNEVFVSLLVYFDRMTRLARETTGAVFAIDSYNVHRLVIAGVTVASKFLSDVFYTNTRYAKVCPVAAFCTMMLGLTP